MRSIVFLFIIFFIVSCLNVNRPDQKVTNNATSSNSFLINIDSVIKAKQGIGVMNITIPYDPIFRITKSYSGIAFKKFMADILQQLGLQHEKLDVIYVCKDGYAPLQKVSDIFSGPESYLLFKNASSSSKKNWPDSLDDLYNPYYLIWNVDSASALNFPWPYGLKYLKLIQEDDLPLDSSALQRETLKEGYRLFRGHCISCHSINNVGGQVGPELNIPKSITEYWSDSNIKLYIRNPQSFRYNAKMPPVNVLSDEQIMAVLEYLHFMKNSKTP